LPLGYAGVNFTNILRAAFCTLVVNFTKILRAAFPPIFLQQKKDKAKLQLQKSVHVTVVHTQ
jgi:hypothetical protein